MNKVILMGRLTRDPEVRYSAGENALAIARYTLAVDRRFKRDGEQSADFINCLAFGRSAEFAEKYFKQGTKIAVSGRIQTGSYDGKDGKKVYTTDVVDATQELENIINFYDEYFEKQRKRKKAAVISVIIAMLMIIFVIVCLYLNTIGII